MSIYLINGWQSKNLTCFYCRKTTSVKYAVYAYGAKINVCNKCVVKYHFPKKKGGAE